MTERCSKVAIVTGASRGIGRSIALRLARDGFAVVVNYEGNQSEAEKVFAEIEAAGGRAIPVQADVSKAGDVERLFDQAEQVIGGVDVLVNTAGIMALKPIAVAFIKRCANERKTMMSDITCSHLDGITTVKHAKRRECDECVEIGSQWVHLRTCQECGTTRCCDSSPNRHASRHARASGHPVIASAEPGERWLYCYPDDAFAEY